MAKRMRGSRSHVKTLSRGSTRTDARFCGHKSSRGRSIPVTAIRTGCGACSKAAKCWRQATAPIICKSSTRDVAHFVCTVIENALTGPFNLAGPRFTWAEFMKIMGAKNVTWVATEVIKTLGVTEFELPLFRPENGPRAGLMDVSNEGAVGPVSR